MVIVEYMTSYPLYSLAAVSIAVTLFSTLIHKWMTNQEHLKHLKARQKEIEKELKNTKDEHVMKELNAELLALIGTMFKSTFRPLFVTLIPLLILFAWLRGFYGGEDPLLAGWIWWYIGFSIASSVIFRKIFKVV